MLQSSEEIYTAIVSVSLIVIMLALGAFIAITSYKRTQEINQQERIKREEQFNKQLLQSQIEVQELTFTTLGKELHDNIGQLLSTAKLLLGISQRSLKESPPDTLLTAHDTIGKAIAELRILSKSLNKEWLEQFSLIQNVQTEVARINSAKVININFEHPSTLDITSDRQVILFRILQEAVQNAIKHSDASEIHIVINQAKDNLQITIQDNGHGFDTQKASEGLGISNMKQRAQLLDGTIQWNSSEKGSRVQIDVPVSF